MQDKTLTCRDCGASFVFTAGEQEFFSSKGFMNEPTRCPSCRSVRKASQGGGGGYSSGGGYSTGGGGYSSGGGGGYERRDREMFPAVCSECGKETQVPFQPRGDKPVYCSDCFANQRGGSTGRSSGGGRSRW